MSADPLVLWLAFGLLITAMLALDLGLLSRGERVMTFRTAMGWSAVWIALALGFAAGIHQVLGPEPALAFLAGYLIEKSLSVDNLFVFLLVFGYFRVAPRHQPVWPDVVACAADLAAFHQPAEERPVRGGRRR